MIDQEVDALARKLRQDVLGDSSRWNVTWEMIPELTRNAWRAIARHILEGKPQPWRETYERQP